MKKFKSFPFIVCVIGFGCQKNIAKVGNIKITKNDLLYEAQVESVYCGKLPSNDKALFKLIQNAIYEDIAIKQGIEISDSMLQAESTRVNRETKAPQLLYAVKLVFGKDKRSYLRLYLKPILVNQLLYGKFYYSDEFQGDRYNIAKNILEKWLSDTSFRDTAFYHSWKYTKGGGKTLLPYDVAIPVELSGVESILDSLPIGKIYPEIIDDRLSYRVIRLIGRSRDEYKVDGFAIEKHPFDTWFQAQLPGISLHIYDKPLRKEVVELVKNTYWTKVPGLTETQCLK
ncbi:MAG: hypothetical protein QMD71_09670 [bacterium]|nr:hypothetical protein [bacterium]